MQVRAKKIGNGAVPKKGNDERVLTRTSTSFQVIFHSVRGTHKGAYYTCANKYIGIEA